MFNRVSQAARHRPRVVKIIVATAMTLALALGGSTAYAATRWQGFAYATAGGHDTFVSLDSTINHAKHMRFRIKDRKDHRVDYDWTLTCWNNSFSHSATKSGHATRRTTFTRTIKYLPGRFRHDWCEMTVFASDHATNTYDRIWLQLFVRK